MTKTKKKTTYKECKQMGCSTPEYINETNLPKKYYGDFYCLEGDIGWHGGKYHGKAWKQYGNVFYCPMGSCYLDSPVSGQYCYQPGT